MTVKVDFLVVGSGMFGSVFAQQAREAGFKVLVLETRPHIGGNCYTKYEEGIHVHTYGAHLFHTSQESVWKYLNRFVNFLPYHHRVKAWAGGKLYSFPINLTTFYEIWGISDPAQAVLKLEQERLKIDAPRNLEEWALSQVGPTLYEKFIKGYTEKQWHRAATQLPAFIIKRLPIRTTFDDSYFNDTYQGIPEGGYTALFEKLLEGIEVKLNCDFFENRSYFESIASQIVFTGRIDAFFNYCEGELAYRTLRFDHTWHECENVQGMGVINYCDREIPYTRILEHRHFDSNCQSKISMTTKEIPIAWQRSLTPYYPINTPENGAILKRYQERSETMSHVHFGGRLAEYKYYDMHHVVASALAKSKQWLGEYRKTLETSI